jgi:hypothetical protein
LSVFGTLHENTFLHALSFLVIRIQLNLHGAPILTIHSLGAIRSSSSLMKPKIVIGFTTSWGADCALAKTILEHVFCCLFPELYQEHLKLINPRMHLCGLFVCLNIINRSCQWLEFLPIDFFNLYMANTASFIYFLYWFCVLICFLDWRMSYSPIILCALLIPNNIFFFIKKIKNPHLFSIKNSFPFCNGLVFWILIRKVLWKIWQMVVPEVMNFFCYLMLFNVSFSYRGSFLSLGFSSVSVPSLYDFS